MQIQCSNCGTIVEFPYLRRVMGKFVREGWNSYGSALYCPECSRTWAQRNSKDKRLAGAKNTISVMRRLHEMQTFRKS